MQHYSCLYWAIPHSGPSLYGATPDFDSSFPYECVAAQHSCNTTPHFGNLLPFRFWYLFPCLVPLSLCSTTPYFGQGLLGLCLSIPLFPIGPCFPAFYRPTLYFGGLCYPYLYRATPCFRPLLHEANSQPGLCLECSRLECICSWTTLHLESYFRQLAAYFGSYFYEAMSHLGLCFWCFHCPVLPFGRCLGWPLLRIGPDFPWF